MKYLIFSMPQFSPRENTSSPLLDFYEGEIWQSMLSAQNSAWHTVSFQRRSVVMTEILPRVECMESGKSTGLWVRRPDLYSNSATEQAVWPWANPSPLWASLPHLHLDFSSLESYAVCGEREGTSLSVFSSLLQFSPGAPGHSVVTWAVLPGYGAGPRCNIIPLLNSASMVHSSEAASLAMVGTECTQS